MYRISKILCLRYSRVNGVSPEPDGKQVLIIYIHMRTHKYQL